jgi:small subunit ribosomal protein S20
LANIQSQIKRNRQNEKRRLRNRDFRGAARSAVRDALAAIATGPESQAAVMAAVSALDKAAAKGAIHHRNAARRKGRLLKRLAALGSQPGTPVAQKTASSAAAGPEKARSAQQRQSARTEKAGTAADQAKAKAEGKKATAKTAAKKPAPKKPAKK